MEKEDKIRLQKAIEKSLGEQWEVKPITVPKVNGPRDDYVAGMKGINMPWSYIRTIMQGCWHPGRVWRISGDTQRAW